MVFSNFNALAMERQGHIAETVSPVIGSISTIMAAIIGYVVGQAYDGALVPLSTGYLALAITVIMIIAVTEKGRFLR
jgi:MFS transporter, DHA1 family, multidrug resistance protein